MDIQAFEAVVKQYSAPLYRYCLYRLSYNRQLTDEAINDIMRILFTKWDELNKDEDLLCYLYRVADNCIMQAKERDYRYYSVHESYDEAIDAGYIKEPQHFDDYFHDQSAEDTFVERITESLPDELRRIFIYRFLEKKTINEIVDLTGIPYSTLRLRISKIEALVRREINNNY